MHLKDKNLKYYRDFRDGKMMINFSNLDFTNLEDNLKIIQINNMVPDEETGQFLYQKNGVRHLSEDYIDEFYEISFEEFEEMFPNFIPYKLDDIKFDIENFEFGFFAIKIKDKIEYQNLIDFISKDDDLEKFSNLSPLYYNCYFYFKRNKLVQSIKSYLPTINFKEFVNNNK